MKSATDLIVCYVFQQRSRILLSSVKQRNKIRPEKLCEYSMALKNQATPDRNKHEKSENTSKVRGQTHVPPRTSADTFLCFVNLADKSSLNLAVWPGIALDRLDHLDRLDRLYNLKNQTLMSPKKIRSHLPEKLLLSKNVQTLSLLWLAWNSSSKPTSQSVAKSTKAVTSLSFPNKTFLSYYNFTLL